jgi:hypothetical protein
MYHGFGTWKESLSTTKVVKWQDPKARVDAWHIYQVGTAKVTGGVHSLH